MFPRGRGVLVFTLALGVVFGIAVLWDSGSFFLWAHRIRTMWALALVVIFA